MEVKLLRVITGEELVAEIIEENVAEVTLKNANSLSFLLNRV